MISKYYATIFGMLRSNQTIKHFENGLSNYNGHTLLSYDWTLTIILYYYLLILTNGKIYLLP